MNRIKKIALSLAGVITVMRLARYAEQWMRYAERADANPAYLGYKMAQHKMGQGRLHQAQMILHDDTASMAEREAAAIVLGYDSAEEALRPENIGKHRPITRATIGEASAAEIAKITQILGHDTDKGAIRSLAYEAATTDHPLKPTVRPPFPGGDTTAPPAAKD